MQITSVLNAKGLLFAQKMAEKGVNNVNYKDNKLYFTKILSCIRETTLF